jgi:vanillate O-demethylase monooxygenase subunit
VTQVGRETELNMPIRNCWYVAAWAHELDAGPIGRTILGEPVCIFRDSSGTPTALADRCAHRGAPLSLGRVEGSAIRCLYHGLKFDSGGRCIEIPGQASIPPQLCVQAYPLVERDRWVWIWMGDPDKASFDQIPLTWSLGHAQWTYKPGYRRFDAPHMLICDNLLDFSHLGYVHPTTLGGTENIALNRPKVSRGESSIRVERWLLDDVPAPFHTKVGNFQGRVDRWHFYDFHVPGILVMYSGVQATGTGAPQGHIENALEFRSCQAVTPEGAGSSHYFYAVPRNFAIDEQAITDKLFQDIDRAFEEDKIIIEAQARILAQSRQWTMGAIGADAALSQFRWLMRRSLNAEVNDDDPASSSSGRTGLQSAHGARASAEPEPKGGYAR